jgi:hypothetical protein
MQKKTLQSIYIFGSRWSQELYWKSTVVVLIHCGFFFLVLLQCEETQNEQLYHCIGIHGSACAWNYLLTQTSWIVQPQFPVPYEPKCL